MNRFTILNISDLHIKGESSKQEVMLKNFAEDLCVYTSENTKWAPDYIVLPGDIIDKSNKNFEHARVLLSDICKTLEVSLGHIILVPGNHDKPSSKTQNFIGKIFPKRRAAKKYSKFVERFLEFEKEQDSNKIKGKMNCFLKDHSNFNAFNTFHEKLSFLDEDKDYTYIPFQPFKGTCLEYVTGIKAFDDTSHKICFLNLNTEWVYQQGQGDKKHTAGGNIVQQLCEKIQEKYHDYTIITLMHRAPYGLSWYNTNQVYYNNEVSLKYIEKCSHIIISGHEHSARTEVPDMLKNQIQHFKLGAPLNEGENFKCSASLIRVDNISHTVELLNGQKDYDEEKKRYVWTFSVNKIIHPLKEKYTKHNWEKPIEHRHSGKVVNLRVQNVRGDVVERKIKKYFDLKDNWHGNFELLICEVIVTDGRCDYSRFMSDIEGIIHSIEEQRKMIHLVLYYQVHPIGDWRVEDEIFSNFVNKVGLWSLRFKGDNNSSDNAYVESDKEKTIINEFNMYKMRGDIVVSVFSVEKPTEDDLKCLS